MPAMEWEVDYNELGIKEPRDMHQFPVTWESVELSNVCIIRLTVEH